MVMQMNDSDTTIEQEQKSLKAVFEEILSSGEFFDLFKDKVQFEGSTPDNQVLFMIYTASDGETYRLRLD